MKEAAGEANLTVVAIILIAVVVAVATPLINSLMKSASWKSCCTDKGGVVNGSSCEVTTNGSTQTYSKDDLVVNGKCKDDSDFFGRGTSSDDHGPTS
jgi:hypothetical protein